MREVSTALDELELDKDVGAVVITGSEKAFAAGKFNFYSFSTTDLFALLFTFVGADIKEMVNNTISKVYGGNFLSHWNRVSQCKKPVIAAVNGYAVSSFNLCNLIIDSFYQ